MVVMVLMVNPRDNARLVANVAKQGVTILPGVPAIYNALNSFEGIEDVDVSSVKSCGPAAVFGKTVDAIRVYNEPEADQRKRGCPRGSLLLD